MKEVKKLRKELIKSKISGILDCINVVEENLPNNFDDFEKLGLVKDGIYKKIEFAIENILDILFIINADLRLGVPEVEDDIFSNLREKKIFTDRIISLAEEMKKFRNILVHKYGKIDDKLAFQSIQGGLKDFEEIIDEIENFLKRN